MPSFDAKPLSSTAAPTRAGTPLRGRSASLPEGVPLVVQRKAVIGAPDDPAEHEADALAERIVGMAPPPAQAPHPVDTLEARVQPQRQPAAGAGGPDAQAAVRGAGQGGEAMNGDLRAYFEPRFGHDFGRVRVHTGGDAAAAASAAGARAYTYGRDVVFGAGEYAPSTPAGRRLIAHELVHVIQQGAVTGAARGAAPAVVQRLASTYKTGAQLEAMTLGAFNTFATDQADWASGAGVVEPAKTQLRSLLEFARNDAGIVLGALGQFSVKDLVAKGAGTGAADDPSFVAYAKGCKNGMGPTVAIKTPATTVDKAAAWGAALIKLEATPGRATIHKVVKQESGARKQNLQELVDAGYVDDFINYVNTVGPNLEASNGAELRSYVDLRGDPADPVTYKPDIPDVLDYHRFEKGALDGLKTNLAAAKGAKPLAVILHSALDWNGAFHRDVHLTKLINRPTHVTLMIEGKATLAGASSLLTPLGAKYKNDGKIDEVMIAGHGDSASMELGGAVTNAKVSSQEDVKTKDPATTGAFYNDILTTMVNSPDSRIVLNACLTNSNKVKVSPLDPDPKKAAAQDIAAIAADPSLATELRSIVKTAKMKVDVRGANASFGSIGLQDAAGKMDLDSAIDPKLTSPDKLSYAEFGTEPSGALRAVLESWANDQAAGKTATIDAVKRRIGVGAASVAWKESVIQALYALIAAAPTDGQRINELEAAAGTLSEARGRENCRVNPIKRDVPLLHRPAIFTRLMSADLFTTTDYIGAVLLQVWMDTDDARKADFIAHLTAKTTLNTSTASDIIDLAHIAPMLGPMLLAPPAPGVINRGEILLACLFLARQGAAAPAAAKAYIAAVVGVGKAHFPAAAKIGDILGGDTTEDEILEAAGLKLKASATPPKVAVGGPAAPTPNIDIGHTGKNNFFVEPLTQRAEPNPPDIEVLKKPGGGKRGKFKTGDTIHIIGKADAYYAVEWKGDTAFVNEADVKIL
jgi:hypothetical protein